MVTKLPDKLTVLNVATNDTEIEIIALSNQYNNTTDVQRKEELYSQITDLVQYATFWD